MARTSSWAGRGLLAHAGVPLAWAALEQGLAAVFPLLLGLAAVRELPLAEHGRLALMAGGLAAGLAVHMAIVLDPLTARGRARPATVGAAVALWALLSLAAGLAAWAGTGLGGLAGAVLLGVAGATGPGLLILARRVAHLHRRPRRAAAAVAVAAAVSLLLAMPATSAEGFLGALAAGSVVGGMVGMRGQWRCPPAGVLRAAIAHHGRMGGWLLLSAGPWLAATQGPVVALAVLDGEAAAGALRALVLLVLPVSHVAAAVGAVAQPRLAAAARHADVRGESLRWGGLIALLAVPWLAALAAAPDVLAAVLLAPDYAGPAAAALPILAAVSLLGAVGAGPAMALRAVRRARPIAVAATLGAAAGVAASLALVPVLGVTGAALALLAARGVDIAAQMVALGLGGEMPRRRLAESAA
ncbi:hypothetical protein ACM64Y_07455 [Novispirillum sp. DQ9]|uniref:hypothetical protein n=1 Tax=Novispirillum sp. DQ9 TaxID=3398612 RepID=UPI003C7A2C71